MATRNAARERWLEYGQRLAASQAERVAAYVAAGLPAPTPAQVRASFIAGSSAGTNARRWLAEGWRATEAKL